MSLPLKEAKCRIRAAPACPIARRRGLSGTALAPWSPARMPTDMHGNPRVLGGFSSSSMESIEVERSSDGTLGDEAIAEAILRELREDAATTGLQIEVEVE